MTYACVDRVVSVYVCVQWSACGDKQAGAWTGAVTSRTAAGTLLAPHHDSPVRTLVALLYFFTATDVPHSEQVGHTNTQATN